MAVLQLLLSVDSEVHPELHGALAALSSPSSRDERLRQLAATGLVWERLRLQTHVLAQARALDLSPDMSDAPRAAAEPAFGVPAAIASTSTQPGPTTGRIAPQLSGGDVPIPDLGESPASTLAPLARVLPAPAVAPALPLPAREHTEKPAKPPPVVAAGAVPGALTAVTDGASAEMFLREMRNAVKELPVLTEVVAPPQPRPPARPAPPAVGAPEPAAASEAASAQLRARTRARDTESPARTPARPVRRDPALFDTTPAAATPAVDGATDADADADAAPPPLDLPPPPPRKPATRTRLMRMQEKGLFHNE